MVDIPVIVTATITGEVHGAGRTVFLRREKYRVWIENGMVVIQRIIIPVVPTIVEIGIAVPGVPSRAERIEISPPEGIVDIPVPGVVHTHSDDPVLPAVGQVAVAVFNSRTQGRIIHIVRGLSGSVGRSTTTEQRCR